MFTAEEESYLVVADIEPVKAFLTTALNSQISGDKAQYELIVHQLRVRDDPETLWKVLVGLCSFSYILTKQAEEFRRLLNCIFGYDWGCEQKVSIAVVNLINHLVTTNSTFLARAFQLYVKSLLPGMTTTLASETVEESLPQRRNLIHRALRSILVQVPTGRSVLYPILCENFPHERFSRTVQTDYTAQLLHICTYEPMLQAKVLELIIMKCLEMDVEIVIEDSGDVRIDEQALDDGELDFDDDLEFDGIANSGNRYGAFNKGKGYGSNNGPGGRRKQLTDTAPTRIPAEVAEMADKLDSVLLLLVQFCEAQIGDTGASAGCFTSTTAVPSLTGLPSGNPTVVASSGTRDRVLQQLLTIFEANIMSIHKSKFVQFVIFFAASLHAPFARAVAEKLLAITLDDRASSTQRQSAVMYLASYLSRAAFLPADFVSDVVSRLLSWAAAYASRPGGGLTAGFGGLSPVPSMQSLPRAHSSGTLRASTSGASLSDRTSREASLENSLSSPGRKGTSTNTIYAAENVEFDEFGRAFVREVTVARHELFYSVVQAACYTLCFYGVGMAARQRDDSAVRACWEAVVTCKFDPLRYCLKTVRIEFIRLAAAVGLFSSQCWDLIPADLLYTEILMQQQVQQTTVKVSRASDNATMTTFTTTEATTVYSSSRVGGPGLVQSQGVVVGGGGRTEVQSANTLDSFFPFDPCLLCKLHKTVENAYRVWDGVPGLDELPDDELYEEEEDDDYDFEEEESVGIAGGGKGWTGKGSKAIPVQQKPQHRRSGEGRRGVANTPGSAMSEGGDAFATSSLSSVVSSIACTDTAMSVVSSMQMSHSPFVATSYLRAAQSMLETSDSAGRSGLQPDDDEDSDDGMHDPHMSAPNSGMKAGGSGAGVEKFDSNYRRPRFYSVGSTGSW